MREKILVNENCFAVYGWMVNRLRLKGNELMIYAIIYGFTQVEVGEYSLGYNYLVEWTGASKNTVIRSVNSLVSKGYISKTTKEINNVLFNNYRAVRGI